MQSNISALGEVTIQMLESSLITGNLKSLKQHYTEPKHFI